MTFCKEGYREMRDNICVAFLSWVTDFLSNNFSPLLCHRARKHLAPKWQTPALTCPGEISSGDCCVCFWSPDTWHKHHLLKILIFNLALVVNSPRDSQQLHLCLKEGIWTRTGFPMVLQDAVWGPLQCNYKITHRKVEIMLKSFLEQFFQVVSG